MHTVDNYPAKQNNPAHNVGKGPLAKQWHGLLVQLAGEENVLHVEQVEQALGMLHNTGLQPRTLIFALDAINSRNYSQAWFHR